MSYGKYPDVTTINAREAHQTTRSLLAFGKDPMAERKAEKEAKSLANVSTFQRVLEMWLEHWKKGLSTRYTDTVNMRVKANILPRLGFTFSDRRCSRSIRLINVRLQQSLRFTLAGGDTVPRSRVRIATAFGNNRADWRGFGFLSIKPLSRLCNLTSTSFRAKLAFPCLFVRNCSSSTRDDIDLQPYSRLPHPLLSLTQSAAI